MDTNHLFITELIRKVQNELSESQKIRENNNQPPLFKIEGLTIEVNFIVEQTSTTKGGFDLRVITSDMEVIEKSHQIHKISLKLAALQGNTDMQDKDNIRDNDENKYNEYKNSGILPRLD